MFPYTMRHNLKQLNTNLPCPYNQSKEGISPFGKIILLFSRLKK
jgi:hypothetical protein